MSGRAAGAATCWHHLPGFWDVVGRRVADGKQHRAMCALVRLHGVALHPGGWLPDALRPRRALRLELQQARRDILLLNLRLSWLMRRVGVEDAGALADYPTEAELEALARQRAKDRLALIPGGGR